MADRRRGPVSWQDDGIWLKRENFLPYAIEQQRTVASGQIPPTHSFAEDDIPADEGFQLGKIKTQAARAMTGDMQRPHLESPHPSDWPLLDQQIIGNGLKLDVESVFFKK